MYSFIQVLRDGLTVLGENGQLVLVILLLILLGQFVIDRVMRSIFGNLLEPEAYFFLGMAGWLVPVVLLSAVWSVLRVSIFPQLNGGIFIVLLAVLAVLLFLRVDGRNAALVNTTVIWVPVFLCISIPLRLAFISDLVMPLYIDSTRHYTIIQSILSTISSGTSAATYPWLTTDYYHVGFHFLATLITSSLDVSVSQTILVMGQMIVAVAPLSFFFLVKHETRSNGAGLFAVLLAGFGWSMPAYALNWGKYPAVTSAALIPFVLSSVYLAGQCRNELTKRKKWILYTTLACAIGISGILHSRSLVVIAIAVLAWLIAGWYLNLPPRPRLLLFCALLLGMLSIGLLIDREDVFEPLFNPYLRQRIYVTGVILFLSIFGQMIHPRWTFASLVAIFLLLCSLFIPTLDLIPRLADRTLLDRPFVEMLLYLPLSLLGGFGISGVVQTLKQRVSEMSMPRILRAEYISALLIILLIGNASLQYDFYPSECCSIVGSDDMKAMEWIRGNTSEDALILIAAEELIVSPFGKIDGYAPTDGGAWITPLTGRATVPISYETNLDKDQKFEPLCKMGIDYIYIGGIGRSFYAPRLRANTQWYTAVLSISRVEVYQVIGCR